MRKTQEGTCTKIRGLGIAMIVVIAAVSPSSSCFLGTETTVCGDDLHCPPGWICSADQDACIRKGSCGDAFLNEGEVCDDGNNRGGDGCSADCTSDETCGNDIIDIAAGELCDDGNTASGDGCSDGCESEECGNWFVDTKLGEECDTGPKDTFGCNRNCKFRRCGDGYVNRAAEECDQLGVTGDTPSCDGDCTFPKCGDKHTNPTFKPPGAQAQLEQCDDGENTASCNGDGSNQESVHGKGICQRPACGDGYHNSAYKPPGPLAKLEACDGGGNTASCNGNGSNGESADGKGICQKPACGDGYYNPKYKPPMPLANFEECDDGGNTAKCNGNGSNGESVDGKGICQEPECGDGYFNPAHKPPKPLADFEKCDDGGNTAKCNGNGSNGESVDGKGACQKPACGDGYHNPKYKPPGQRANFEECDTGGNSPGCNGNGNPTGQGNCQIPECGDGYYNPAFEVCDRSAPVPNSSCGNDVCTPACTCG